MSNFHHAVDLHINKGLLDVAIPFYRAAMKDTPYNPVIHTNLGALYQKQGNLMGALSEYEQAINIDPKHALAWQNLGALYKALHRLPEALGAAKKAAELRPHAYRTQANYGDLLVDSGQYQEAIQVLSEAVLINPLYAPAHNSLGRAFWGLNRFERAEVSLRHAIQLQPDFAHAHQNLGMLLLSLDRYPEGWREYDWRFIVHQTTIVDRPLWEGQPLKGALLVTAEQGVGDELWQLTMAADLLSVVQDVYWEVDKRLHQLVKRAEPRLRLIERKVSSEIEVPDDIVAQIPAGSLGHILRQDRGNFPHPVQRVIAPDANLVSNWMMSIKGSLRRRIGFAWASTSAAWGPSKSIPPVDLAGFLMKPFQFVNLQFGPDRRIFGDLLETPEIDAMNNLDSIAAIIANCDSVVTVSNTVAHIASAMGKPTYVLLASGGSRLWYWGAEGEYTPWYMNTRIIRQQPGETWNSVIWRLERRLGQRPY